MYRYCYFGGKICVKTQKYPRMIFNRKFYLEQLISAKGNGMIKIITGIRRCGKSFLLFNIFKKYLIDSGVDDDHIVQVNLEDRRNKQLRNPDALLDYIDNCISDSGKYYILIDEVQLVENFEDVLNSYLSMPNVEVYVTGSNAKFLSKDIITTFRGRGWEIRIHPLSFSEYFEVVGGGKVQAMETYFRYGGLPAVAMLDNYEDKQKYLEDIFETVYMRDVVERNKLKNAPGMRQVVRILASCIGTMTNIKRIADTFKSEYRINIKPETVSKYIECLEDSFLVSEALRYDVKGRKYIGAGSKFYFEDVGIRNVILNFRQTEPTHIMENVVYNELRKRGYSVDVGAVEMFKRDSGGKLHRCNLEIDFVVNRHDKRLYIQSAYAMPDAEKLKQEQASLLDVHDGFGKMIVAADCSFTSYNENGILIVSLFEFCMQQIV